MPDDADIPAPDGIAGQHGDAAEVAARFGAALRRAGLPGGPGRSERFAAAITLVQPVTRRELFDCALATLVSGQDQARILLLVFTGVFGSPDDLGPLAAPGLPGGRPPPAQLAEAASNARAHAVAVSSAGEAVGGSDDDTADREVTRPYLGSPVERLAGPGFAELTAAELAELADAMRRVTLAVPALRAGRRRRRPGGPPPD